MTINVIACRTGRTNSMISYFTAHFSSSPLCVTTTTTESSCALRKNRHSSGPRKSFLQGVVLDAIGRKTENNVMWWRCHALMCVPHVRGDSKQSTHSTAARNTVKRVKIMWHHRTSARTSGWGVCSSDVVHNAFCVEALCIKCHPWRLTSTRSWEKSMHSWHCRSARTSGTSLKTPDHIHARIDA